MIHLRDVHGHPEAQQRIGELVGYLRDHYGIELVAVEGATGLCDTALYSDFPDPPSTEQIARLFVQEGLFTGSEYYAITHPGRVTLWGVEDEAVYLDHLKASQRGIEHHADAERTLTQLRELLTPLRATHYPETLRQLLTLHDASEHGQEGSFEPYLRELTRLAGELQIDLAPYPHVRDTREASALYPAIDVRAVQADQQRLLETLTPQLTEPERERLRAEGEAVNAQQAPAQQYYAALTRLAGAHGLWPGSPEGYPALRRYLTYLALSEQISVGELSDEVDALQLAVEDASFTTEPQRALARLLRRIALLDGLVHLQLSPTQLRDYQGARPMFTADTLAADLQRVSPPSSVTRAHVEQLLAVLPIQERFYELAARRDEALTQHALRQIADQPTKTAILIAGGFHTPGITQRLREERIAYAVIMPAFTGEADEALYQSRLRNTIPPLDELIRKLNAQALVPSLATGSSGSPNSEFRVKLPDALPDRQDQPVPLSKHDATFLSFLTLKARRLGSKIVDWIKDHPDQAARYGIVATLVAQKLVLTAMGVEFQFDATDGTLLAMGTLSGDGKSRSEGAEEPPGQPAQATSEEAGAFWSRGGEVPAPLQGAQAGTYLTDSPASRVADGAATVKKIRAHFAQRPVDAGSPFEAVPGVTIPLVKRRLETGRVVIVPEQASWVGEDGLGADLAAMLARLKEEGHALPDDPAQPLVFLPAYFLAEHDGHLIRPLAGNHVGDGLVVLDPTFQNRPALLRRTVLVHEGRHEATGRAGERAEREFLALDMETLTRWPADAAGGVTEQLRGWMDAGWIAPTFFRTVVAWHLKATAYADPSQAFDGVDLEHYVHAQYELANKDFPEERLAQVLLALQARGLVDNPTLTGADGQQAAVEALARGGAAKDVIDLVNANTYADPRLEDLVISGQNRRPRAQGVVEAIANSLDALGLDIGQFGKGVKQIIDWLEPNGRDRLDVFTKAAGGAVYHLTILRDVSGQHYLQMRVADEAAFREAAGEPLGSGTVVRVSVREPIPRRSEEDGRQVQNSQEQLTETIHRQFPYVTAATITTQSAEQSEPSRINGYATKPKWVLAGRPLADGPESESHRVSVRLMDDGVTVTDNGLGMEAVTIAGMFVPGKGTKRPEPLRGETAQAELAKVAIVHDPTLPHRISFARTRRVAVAVDVPEPELVDSATLPGGLMLEFGRLLDVPESWDQVIIPTGLGPKEVSNFELAVRHAITELLEPAQSDASSRALSDEEKLRAVNTLIVGLDGLMKGNPRYEHTIKGLRAFAARRLAPLIGRLQSQGVVILPHQRAFAMLAMPQGRRALYLHPQLFRWDGAQSLRRELGADVVPGILLGDEHKPLVVADFTPESLTFLDVEPASGAWDDPARMPVIRTGELVAIPRSLGRRLLELARRRQEVEERDIPKAEQREFKRLLQYVNILTAEQVITGYETGARKTNVRLSPRAQFPQSVGEVDSTAVNRFLVEPPPGLLPQPAPVSAIPPTATQRLVVLKTGEIIEVGTGRRLRIDDLPVHATELEGLGHGFYKLIFKFSPPDPKLFETLVEFDGTSLQEWQDMRMYVKLGRLGVSPDKRFVAQAVGGVVVDLTEGSRRYLVTGLSSTVPGNESPSFAYSDVQFSADGKYLTCLERYLGVPDGPVSLLAYDLTQDEPNGAKKQIKDILLGRWSKAFEYAAHPVATNLISVRHKGTGSMMLIDLADGALEQVVVSGARRLHTDSTGTWTAVVDGDGAMSLYLHKAPSGSRWIAQPLQGKQILSARTSWKSSGEVFFEVGVYDPDLTASYYDQFDEAGRVSKAVAESGFFPTEIFAHPQVQVTTMTYPPFPDHDVVVIDEDALQRSSGPGVHRHPDFPLLIDHRHPNNPMAIDLATGEQFHYQGEIVHYEPKARQLWARAGPRITVMTSAEGRIQQIDQIGFSDGTPAQAIVYVSDVDGSYKLGRPRTADGVVEIIDLPWSPSDYDEVSFDGTHFVFVNTTTGDVVYLDPAHPEAPVAVAARQASTTPTPTGIPSDASQRLVLGEGGRVVELGTGRLVATDPTLTSLEPLGGQAYLAGYFSGGTRVWFFDPSQPDAKPKEYFSQGPHIVSPDRRYVAAFEPNVQFVGVLNLRTQAMWQPELDASAYRVDVQFSASGRYVTYLHYGRDGTSSSLRVVDLETGQEREALSMGGSSGPGILDYALNPHANLAFVRDQGQLITVVDLTNTQPPLAGQAIHSDSSGTYTALVEPGKQLSIYLHKAKRLLTQADFGAPITGVVTVWTPDGPRFHAFVDDTTRPFDATGQLGRPGDYATGPFEEFDDDGQLTFGSPDQADLRAPDDRDPLERRDRKGVYRHPHLPLLIDRRDPFHPVAVYPMTGRTVSLQKGDEILSYHVQAPVLDVLRGNALWMPPGPQPIPIGEILALSRKADGTIRYMLMAPQPDWRTSYLLADYTTESSVTHALPQIPTTLDRVSFDGTYFVFANPATGEAIFLHPERPDQPIFITAQPKTQALSPTKPADAPYRFVIGHTKDGVQTIFDMNGTSPQLLPDAAPNSLDRFERVNERTFIKYYPAGWQVVRIHPVDLARGLLAVGGGSAWSRILERTDRLILFEQPQPVLVPDRRQWLFDMMREGRPKSVFASARVHLSASGRYTIHERSGRLSFYDHESEKPGEEEVVIADAGTYQSYRVHDRADVVILAKGSDRYGLFSLSLDKTLAVYADHIEIDSSGTFAVVSHMGTLGLVNLKTGRSVSSSGFNQWNEIRIASDEAFVYVLLDEEDEHRRMSLRKSDGSQVDLSGALPRFWEAYDLERKTIWDREQNRPYQSFAEEEPLSLELRYREDPSRTDHVTLLPNGIAVYRTDWTRPDGSKHWDVTLEDLAVSVGRQAVYRYLVADFMEFASDEGPRLQSLAGDRVWYTAAINNGEEFVSVASPTMEESFQRVLVTSSRRFLLGMQDAQTFLIDAEGHLTSLTPYLPPGFVATDVNGEYFVFTNPATGELRYLDPRAVMAPPDQPAEPAISAEEIARQERVQARWEQEVLLGKDEELGKAAWIAQIRGAMTPVLELTPGAFRGAIEQEVTRLIERAYEDQEREIRRRFEAALPDHPLALKEPPLPFDVIGTRLAAVKAALEEFLPLGSEVIDQEEPDVRRRYYTQLFTSLMGLALNRELAMPMLEGRLLELLGYGWPVSNAQQAADWAAVSDLVSLLSQLHTGSASLSFAERFKLVAFCSAVSRQSPESHAILIRQLKRLTEVPVGEGLTDMLPRLVPYLTSLRESFQQVEESELIRALTDSDVYQRLGDARPFVVFLSQDVAPLKERGVVAPLDGEEIALPEGGVELSQLMNLDRLRDKAAHPGVVMSLDYLLGTDEQGRRRLDHLPERDPDFEAQLLRRTTGPESRAYTREIAQNSRDATIGSPGELLVDFYLQTAPDRTQEYVEEDRDNGPGALKEMALLLPKSTKTEGEQMEQTGFFGTGKYTIFEGVDRVEFISKNSRRAVQFTLTVSRDASGAATGIRLTGLRLLRDPALAAGVTVRRITKMAYTIPELDAALDHRAWERFTGLSQYESKEGSFRIVFLNARSEREPLDVKPQVLAEVPISWPRLDGSGLREVGTVRLIQTRDLPVQFVDGAGLRVGEVTDDYMVLIPPSLRHHLRDLHVNIQIPLRPTESRGAFKHEDIYESLIHQAPAAACYRMVAFKALTETSPQFIPFSSFPMDWLAHSTDHYWKVISDVHDEGLVAWLNPDDASRPLETADRETRLLRRLTQDDEEAQRQIAKLILLARVPLDPAKPQERTSLAARRLAIQQQANKRSAEKFQRALGISAQDVPSVGEVPFGYELVGMMKEKQQSDLQNPDNYVVEPSTPEEQELMALAAQVGGLVGLRRVFLTTDQLLRSKFTARTGTIYLRRSVAHLLGEGKLGVEDVGTDAIVHETAHYLEHLTDQAQLGPGAKDTEVYSSPHGAHERFTHQPVGRFASAMKFLAAKSLAVHQPPAPEEPPRPIRGGSGLDESDQPPPTPSSEAGQPAPSQLGTATHPALGAGSVAVPDVPTPPMAPAEVIDYLQDRLDPLEMRQVTRGALTLRTLLHGQKSLHLGSGLSHLPVAESLMGLKVTAVEVMDWKVRDVNSTLDEARIRDEITRRGGSFDYLVTDWLKWDTEERFEHVTAIDFVPEPRTEEVRRRSPMAAQDVELLQQIGEAEHKVLASRIAGWIRPGSTVLLGVMPFRQAVVLNRLQELGVVFDVQPVDQSVLPTQEPLLLLRIRDLRPERGDADEPTGTAANSVEDAGRSGDKAKDDL